MNIVYKVTIGILVGLPMSLMAETATLQGMKSMKSMTKAVASARVVKSTVSCPVGWTKTLDKSAYASSRWAENAPVVTCKPKAGQVMKCPAGTYFYVKGNEFMENAGEIGCHTPVR